MEEILTVTACRTEGFSAKYLRIQDFPQDLSQLLPGFHGFVEERSRDVNRHRIVAFLEGLNRVFGDGINILDGVLDGFRHECSENQLPELQMVVSLVKENGLFPQHPLFASRECEENIGVLRVKLECFSNVWPAKSAWWETQFLATKTEPFFQEENGGQCQ
nr:hypothetical protein Iba_chr13aCG4630 [Ipomoea batatas]GMD74606.1 hypothetical protein Iba_chr13aCG6900 [Ipomoea batatas]GMD76103.1 hypothetical protein Iba_chr13bCG7120 [Ipomoea batatas]